MVKPSLGSSNSCRWRNFLLEKLPGQNVCARIFLRSIQCVNLPGRNIQWDNFPGKNIQWENLPGRNFLWENLPGRNFLWECLIFLLAKTFCVSIFLAETFCESILSFCWQKLILASNFQHCNTLTRQELVITPLWDCNIQKYILY